MQITVTVDANAYAVRLEATEYTGTVHWARRYQGVDEPVGDGPVVYDYEPAFGVPYEYIATDDVEAQVSAPVQVDSDNPVLSVEGQLYAVPVVVLSYRPSSYVNASTVWPILGRNDPLVTVHPTLYPSGKMRLHAARYSNMVDLLALLPSGRPLTLRSTCPERVPSMTFAYERAEVGYTGDRAVDVPAYVDLDYQQVEKSPGIAPPPYDRTWQTILDGHTTWQEVLDTNASWLRVLEGNPA